VVGLSPRVDEHTNPQYRDAILSPGVAVFAAVAAVLWVITVAWANEMGNMPGTMGMTVPEFVVMWALMMAAMMLPSVAPMATLYSRTVTSRRAQRLGLFGVGYLISWAATGVVAYTLAWTAGELAADAPDAARAVGVATFVAVGLYQLTPLKYRCLEHCRSPIGHMFHYAQYTGRTKDLRAGVHHGMFCLGCCWALMLLMIVFGVMNVWAMIALAVVVAAEKLWKHGEALARAAGWASIGLAIAVAFEPSIAPGIDPDGLMMMGDMGM